MHLFALQLAELPTWIFIIAVVAIALLFFGFFFWLVFKQAAKSRELSHLERMKALETGQPIGPSEAQKCQEKYLHNIFWIGFWVGAGVPFAAIAGASSVMIQTHLQEFRILLVIWIGVAIISIASVVCATTLMISTRHWSANGEKKSSGNGRAGSTT